MGGKYRIEYDFKDPRGRIVFDDDDVDPRKNHKFSEWVEFCKWIETLPFSELITNYVDIPREEPVVPNPGTGPKGYVRTEEEIERDQRKIMEERYL